MYGKEAQIDIAGSRPTASITTCFTDGYAYLKFVVNEMCDVARWYLSMWACSAADAEWGRILYHNLHSFEQERLSGMSTQ